VYRQGEEPSAAEIGERVERYWRPYHQALAEEIERLRATHGRVLLWEAHSIRGECPFLFEGRLPDLNLGTAAGASCSPTRQDALQVELAAQTDYDWVINGRFKGGYITRNYGCPERGIDAVQLEIAQRTYMDEASFEYQPERAARLQGLLRRLLGAALAV
jgi:N-formylglutamate deformylase